MCQLDNQQVTKPSTLSICGRAKLEKYFAFYLLLLHNRNCSKCNDCPGITNKEDRVLGKVSSPLE